MPSPKLVQFWDSNPPDEVLAVAKGWRSAARRLGLDYVLHDDGTALAFIAEHLGPRVAAAYAICAVPAMRADLFRYCALLIHGGVYVDADIAYKALPRDCFWSQQRGLLFQREKRVANDFMVVRHPNDGLIERILELAIQNIERRRSNSVWDVTGPGIATRLLRDFGQNDALFSGYRLLPVAALTPHLRFCGRMAYKQTDSHWINWQKASSIFRDEVGAVPVVAEASATPIA